jgi:hypothetical protein
LFCGFTNSRFMPHFGHCLGLSEVTSGCIGHAYFATFCEALADAHDCALPSIIIETLSPALI